MPRRLVFHGPAQVECEAFELPAVGADQVLVRVEATLVSTGTETTVFNRRFAKETHWDQWVSYPFYPGYAGVGEVMEVGTEVKTLKPGDRVVTRGPHASHHVLPAVCCLPYPAELDPRQAVWFALAKIAAMGARVAEFALGDEVLVIGAGPIGQMALRWARAAGAEKVLAVDTVAMRLELARLGGATETMGQPIEACREVLQQRGELPNVVFDTTGHPAVFEQALMCTRSFGRVVILGDAGAPAEQRLSPDVITRGLTIVGAHDSHERPEWNALNIARLFFSLVQTGRFNLERLNTHVFKPEACAEAYELASKRRAETMGIIFDWAEAAI